MAASRMDVAQRLPAFEFACHAMDVAFSEVHCLPKFPRPALRDRGNPMELYDEEQFHARYRFTKNAMRQLLAMLPLQESGDNRGQPVPPMLHLLMALRFYGAGTFQTVTGDLVRIPQSTVRRAVGKVTLLIAKHLYSMLVRFPQLAGFPKVMRDFYEVAEFPGVTGCVDCRHLDACLAVNGVTAQPLMHDILLDALPAELRHLSAASSSSPQPYDDLCAAVLARYGETYRPLPGTREFRVSHPSTRAVPPGPQPSHDLDLPSPAMSLSTSRPATSAVVPAPDDPPDDVQDPTPEVPAPDDVAAAIDQSATSRVSSTPSADDPSGMPAIRPSSLSSPAHDTSLTSDSTLATLPHDLEADTDNLSPAVRPSLAEVSPSTIPVRDLPSSSAFLASSDPHRPRRLPQQQCVPLTNFGRTCGTRQR
ncbi:hypothetical protein HPB52_021550 [Rhipicephalus sanguineus]|uniref:Nuclease HARBI1 n=1 Tax=Rhipicephalus sanguineus TaxID=34632 RepID=A0A9D4PFG4_RHISA|nr:hypothetical protein HPB52_021550 [Rhipicephalus sanguineus]